jgi:putative transcriptional regulator
VAEPDTGPFARDGGLDSLLAAYACGAVSRPLAVLVESHCALRPASRSFVGALEGLGGSALDAAHPLPLKDRGAALSAIFAEQAMPEISSVVEPVDPVLPAPLRRYLGHGLDEVRWRWLMPGLKEHRFADKGVSLLWAKGGAKMPVHTHDGVEVTLVLSGAFSDKTGRYARGDIEIGDDDLDHQPIVEKGEDCVCFVVAEGALRLTGPFGRWIDRLQSH